MPSFELRLDFVNWVEILDKELKISSSTPKHSLFTGHIAACILTLHCRNLDPETQNAGNAEHEMQQVLNGQDT